MVQPYRNVGAARLNCWDGLKPLTPWFRQIGSGYESRNKAEDDPMVKSYGII